MLTRLLPHLFATAGLLGIVGFIYSVTHWPAVIAASVTYAACMIAAGLIYYYFYRLYQEFFL